MDALKYLAGYSEATLQQVRQLIAQDKVGEVLARRYAGAHEVTTDKALYTYVSELKNEYLRTAVSRVQGGKLKAKREIRIAPLFKALPLPFLSMIVAHELAHFKEKDHDKAFYKLCVAMEPDYHQIEFDLRLYLTYLDLRKPPLWTA